MSDIQTEKLFESGDIWAAFSLLSRLPVPVDHSAVPSRAAAATWAYPLVGACLGGIGSFAGVLAIWFGAPTGIAAAVSLAVLAMLTGAMHEDGLADCADGLGGGSDRESRLAIMKDSNIGAFGAVALIIAIIARWSGIEGLGTSSQLFWPMVAVGAASRLPMVLAMQFMEPARTSGLSASVGRPPPSSVLMAGALVIVICLVSVGWAGLFVVFWACLAAVLLFYLAQKLIGGQTGDVLGGSQQLAEIAALAVLVSG